VAASGAVLAISTNGQQAAALNLCGQVNDSSGLALDQGAGSRVICQQRSPGAGLP
jgi:hypothetical protein